MGLFGGKKKSKRSLDKRTSRSMRSRERRKPAKQDTEDRADNEESTMCICFLLLADANPMDGPIVEAAAKRTFGKQVHIGDDEEGDPEESDDGSVVFIRVGDKPLGFIGHMPMPIPESEASHAAEGNPLWPNGGADAAQHQSHCVIAYMGGEPDLKQRLINLSKLAAVAVRAAGERAIGVYWGNGSISNRADFFADLAEEASVDALPLHLWMRFQFVSGDRDGEVGMYTYGLSQFDLMEIEVEPLRYDPEALFEFVFNIASYLVNAGPVIKDGDTIGGSEEERIKVFYKESMIEDDKTVYQIQLPEQ